MREDDNMKKNDLISGKHVVELEDGSRYLYLEGRFVNSRFWYDTDVKICKIFEIQEAYSLSDMLVFDKGLNLIWERKPELSDAERVILENVDKKYKYIARDEGGNLFIYSSSEIEKFMNEWYYGNDKGVHFSFAVFNNLFKMVKWKDEEPTLIADLLGVDEPFRWPE